MEDQSYKVILEGKIREGFDRPITVKNLSALLRRDVEEIAGLLSGNQTVIARGLDHRTALRHQALIEGAGAVSCVEPDAIQPGPANLVDQSRDDEPQAVSNGTSICPRCGYTATREDDVLLIRGDCPRCGLQVVTRPADPQERVLTILQDDPLSEFSRNIYGKRTPASRKRKVLASIHTFSLFLAVYSCLIVLFIFCFVPLESVPAHFADAFLNAAFTSFPLLLPALSLILVSFVLPIFNRGLSWGQRRTGIVVLYTKEAQAGGLYLSLAFRVVAIGLLSFSPGLIVIWAGSKVGIVWTAAEVDAVMAVMAILGWVSYWVYLARNPEKIGILDRAAGTIQTEQGPLPEHAVKDAVLPIGVVAALSVILGIIIPLCPRLLK
ncbi:MAG: hypothetical protein WBG50_10600 [Desulfomonilaceae bacterium]